ncbi:hypothetical protein J3R30DRAFT_3523786 [Lentinula aciculospora]|uniref:Proteasome subunit alpha type 1 n=1 Tax=Lentinula aciculospora TaxID=153920 RepID=A0A9W9A2H4_9AGAR|nr:hypothetical protein J3R30DRAFT_3523786 [Lentinula aciculospora]
MNKNPFGPQSAYTPPPPPLPPGPPPPQPAQPDYSAYWAAVQQQQHQQQPPVGSYPPQQWPAQPRPPAEQNALYANYGYGPQNQWQRQQQQQLQQQQQQQFHAPPPVVQPPPPPQAPPGYNPYQPAVNYAQPYVPQAPQAMTQTPYNPMGRPLQVPSQPMFNPHIPPQPVPPMQQQQRHVNQPSLQHQPPAKRQRFDGPSLNQQIQQRQNGPQQQFQPPLPPNQPSGAFSAGRGGGPGSNQMPLGGRGGRGGSLGNMARGRGGSMNAGRSAGMGNRNSRGGASFNVGSNNSGRGGGGAGLRGHNSRGHLGPNKDFHNRRGGGGGGSFNTGGGGSFSHQNASFRGRGYSHSNSNRPQRHDGNNGNISAKDASAPGTVSGKKDENRRTLTDFKMVGLEIPELSWSWGVLGKLGDDTHAEDIDLSSQVTVKMEEVETLVMASSDTIESDAKTEPNGSNAALDAEHKDTDTDSKTIVNGSAPHSRIRIYFHTPVSPDDSHPIVPNSFSLGVVPSDSRKGKRKKLDDDEDGDGEDGRRPPPNMNDDRSSVAASGTHSVAESGSEADWLMAAITDGEQTQPDPDAEGDEDDDERLHVSEIVEYHDNMSEMGEGDDHSASQGKDDSAASENHSFSASVDVTSNVSPENETNDGKTEVMNSTDTQSVLDPHASADANASSLSSVHDNPSTVSNTASVFETIFHGSVPYASRSYSDEHVDHTEHADPQVLPITETIEHTTNTAILSDPELKTAPETPEQSQEHLPEPPASPVSNTLLSTSSSSTFGDSNSHTSDKDKMTTQTPSANRLSISYSNGNRRMVINAEVVEKMEIHRSEGRIEAEIKVQRNSDNTIQGILVEGLSDVTKSYVPLPFHEKSEADSLDPTLPPFANDLTSTSLTLIAHLDTKRPLSQPRWVRTGDIQDWLRSMFGRMFWVAGDAADGWEKKITVVDPDPPPTIWTVLEGWAQNSPAGVPTTERHRFLKTHLSETENVLEILLRLVRGERATPFSSAPTISAPSVSGPLLSALSQATAHGSQQTHVSLAVLAMFQMSVDYATKALGENGKKEVDERIGEIIRCLPSHLIYKSLDGIFKEWRVEKKGR